MFGCLQRILLCLDMPDFLLCSHGILLRVGTGMAFSRLKFLLCELKSVNSNKRLLEKELHVLQDFFFFITDLMCVASYQVLGLCCP